MRKLLLTTSALVALGAAPAFAADSSGVTISGGSDYNQVAVTQTSSGGSQSSTVSLTADSDYNDPLTITQTDNTNAASSLSIDGSDSSLVSVSQVGNAYARSSIELKQASHANTVGVFQTGNLAETLAEVNLHGSVYNHVVVAQTANESAERASAVVTLDAADNTNVAVSQEDNSGAEAKIDVTAGSDNSVAITQLSNLAAKADLAVTGSSNELSVYQWVSHDATASINVAGFGNTLKGAGGYSINQSNTGGSSATISITGDDNTGGISQMHGTNLLAEMTLTNSNRNMVMVNQSGLDNTSVVQLNSAHDNSVTHTQSGSLGSATTTIDGSSSNVVNVSQM